MWRDNQQERLLIEKNPQRLYARNIQENVKIESDLIGDYERQSEMAVRHRLVVSSLRVKVTVLLVELGVGLSA